MKLSDFLKQPFFTGSILVLLGVNLYNFGQTIFHLIIGRFLGKSGYAEFAAIVSVLAIIIIIQQALGLTFVKFISSAKTKAYVTNFTRWAFYWSIGLGILLMFLVLLIAPFLKDFLYIKESHLVLILGPIIFLLVLINTLRSIFQGLLKFGWYIFNLLSEAVVKILLAIIFIAWGWATFGVFVSIIISVSFAIFLAFFPLREYLFGKKGTPPDILPLFKYSVPVLFLSLALTSMNSSDIILVKHFFSNEDAGLYAALAKLGSVAFFGAAPICSVMFPFIARNHSKGEPYNKLFFISILLVLLVSIPVVLLYKFNPPFVVKLLYGSQFVAGSEILWWFGAYMLLLGVAVLFTQFYFSIGKTKTALLFVLAALLQTLLIWFIHPTILSVIQVSLFSVSILVASLLIYYPFHKNY